MGMMLGLMGLLVALARLPLIRTPVDVSPDGCEYLGIARHLIGEHRWVSSLKWNFFSEGPVTHPALADRSPLFPLWAAGWMALSARPETQVWLARLGNLLLAAAVPAMLFWALQPAVAAAAAALAALIFMLYPGFLRNSAQPLTEPLFLLLLFGSLGRFLRARSPLDWSVSGLLAGFAALTRPTGLLLPVLYSVAIVASGEGSVVSGDGRAGCHPSPLTPHHPGRWRSLFLVLIGFILPLVPYWIAVAAQTGSPFTSILRYNYSIRHIDEGTFYGFERSFEPPVVFVRSHAGAIAGLIAQQWMTMGSALGRSLQYLLPLALFWRREPGWKRGVLLGLALLNFGLHAMSWAVWGAARYLFPTYIIGMALLLDAPIRWARRLGGEGETGRRGGIAAAAAVAAAAAWTIVPCLQQDARLYREKAASSAGVRLGWAYAAAADRLARTPPGTLCAANQPWIVNLLARRPAVMAPRFRDAAQLRRYLARYRPAALTLFVTAREPQDVATAQRLVENLWTQPQLRPELADVLELEGSDARASSASREARLVFRVRPTWRSYGR